MRFKYGLITVLAASVLLAACGSGDGGNDGKTKASFNKVVSFGASLTDSGTFGYKFTVQQAAADQQNVLWNERIAKLYGIATTCAVFNSSLAAANAGTCTNYAVAGSNINNYDSGSSTVDNTSPKSILAQLGTAATVGGFDSKTLVLVGGDSGANDIAAMLTDLLTAVTAFGTASQTAAFNAYFTRVNSLVSSLPTGSQATYTATVSAAEADVATATDLTSLVTKLATVGGIYEKTVAGVLAGAIQQYLIANGATHVAVQNTLDVTKTPQFQSGIPQKLAAAGVTDTATIASLLGAVSEVATTWLDVYNGELETQLSGVKGIALVDFYTQFNNEMNHPTQYGLDPKVASWAWTASGGTAGVTPPVCTAFQAAAGIASTDTTNYDSLSPSAAAPCTPTTLASAAPTLPAALGISDTSANWWEKMVFANSFHPTPYGHKLLAQMTTDILAKAGWL